MSFASIASPSVVPGEPGDGLTWDLARPWPQRLAGRFDLVIRAQVRDVGGNTGGGRQGGRSAARHRHGEPAEDPSGMAKERLDLVSSWRYDPSRISPLADCR